VTTPLRIIGAGLAGTEAAWQCARRGVPVELYEMRPVRQTPAHQTAQFAELVCSNSLKSVSENTAPWLLKEEMRRAGSLLMEIARQTAVPAGHAGCPILSHLLGKGGSEVPIATQSQRPRLVSGHGFSRAERPVKRDRALAPVLLNVLRSCDNQSSHA